VSAPLFDGNTLRSSELAALERANAATDRLEQARRTLQADISERATQAENNLRRVTEFSDLLVINSQVRDNFFIQWAALGRRTLFELLAIEAEQFSILSGYYNALHDAMIANAVVAGTIGLLTGDPADYQRPNEH
jgi:outer membrane protein TolC